MSVSGSNSTLNNTDTSAATTLPPASSTSAREADSEDSSAKYPEGTGGVPEFKGSHQPSGYSGGPSDSNTGTDSSSNTNADYSSTTNTASNTANTDNTGSFENADPAPSYIISQAATGGKPKGTNITEGGFESDDKNNASFNTDVDSENDPARLANQKMQRMNASTTGEHSGGPAETGTAEDGSGAYDALGSESQI
ncbi:hypothetical protein MMC25_000294 [Agyrium rufum]|nr:hypothetical protein [Agyrium rufum]